MTPQQIVALGVRLFALWLAISSFQYLVQIPAAFSSARPMEIPMQTHAIGSAYVASAILLWIFPMWTAHKLLPRTRFENKIRLGAVDAARVGCALIGLWLFCQGLLTMVWFLFRSFFLAGSQSTFASLGPDAKVDFVVSIVYLVVGVVLVARTERFAVHVVGWNHDEPNDNDDRHHP